MKRNFFQTDHNETQFNFSRLIAATFKIFAREVLGYQFTMVTEEQERNESAEMDDLGISREFDTAVSTTTINNNEYPNNILAKLSSCESMM